MIFRQITHDELGCASYLIGDEDAGVAAVVDPKLDINEYLRLARYIGVSIVSGHGRLAAATGATIHIHEEASPDYEHEAFADGWELELGATRVRAVHTPGHRPAALLALFAVIFSISTFVIGPAITTGTSEQNSPASEQTSQPTAPGPTEKDIHGH